MTASANKDRESLNWTTKLAYGAGDLGAAITTNILVFYLLPFFTNVANLPADIAGSILMIGKISDAINDPIIGAMSDRTTSRWGRRLPWMIYGAVPFGVIYILQWIVPEFSNNRAIEIWCLFVYYVLVSVVFNIAFTAVNLPYTALTPELTRDYNERTKLNSFRFTFSIGGSIVSLILAKLVFDAYPNSGVKPYFILGIICTLLSVIPILWCAVIVTERGAQPILDTSQKRIVGKICASLGSGLIFWGILGSFGWIFKTIFLINIVAIVSGILIALCGITLIYYRVETHLLADNNDNLSVNANASLSILEQLKIAFSNKPFLYVIGIYLCSWLAVQLTASILIYFVVSWMGLKNSDSSLAALAVQGTALLMLFFWQNLSARYGKKIVYFMGTIVWIIAQGGLFLLQPGQISLMYLLAVMAGCGVSVAYLIPWSMIPDVIELDELNTGQRREGIFYGFMVLLQKFGLALGLFLVGLTLKTSGFISSAEGDVLPTQPESALFAIRIAIGPLPTIVLILGLILAYFYPITQEVHAEIRLKLLEKQTKTS
jgi:GPH family glycoside/pentoside/hexuronide:cation symporter